MNFSISIFKHLYSYRNFVRCVLIVCFTMLSLIGIVNYVIDPLRMFSHKNRFNEKQLDFDERQQKTNYLKFVAIPQNIYFDSILLGSSRTTYINQNHFEGLHVFNYAANSLSPYEYDKFIDYFTKTINKEPKNIILGIDFFGTAIEKNQLFTQDNHLTKTLEPLYKFKTLLNLKLAKYSIRNIKQSSKSSKPYYTRDNIKFLPDSQNYKPKKRQEIEKHFFKFKNYQFDEHLKDEYIKLKNTYVNSHFIIYTSPVTCLQLQEYEKNNYLEYYFRWLQELVEVFGEVHHFMYPNSITNDVNNFFDATHMLPKTGDYIAQYITKHQKFRDFGITLTKDNIEQFITDYPKYSKICTVNE